MIGRRILIELGLTGLDECGKSQLGFLSRPDDFSVFSLLESTRKYL